MKVDIDGVEADKEVDETVLLGSGDVGEEGGGDGLAGGEGLANEDVELEGLGVDVADVDTTFVGEEDGVTLALGVDADVEFCVGRVREEGLEDEVVQGPGD